MQLVDRKAPSRRLSPGGGQQLVLMEYLAQFYNEPASSAATQGPFTLIDFPGQVVLNLDQSLDLSVFDWTFLVLTAAPDDN